MKKRSNYFLNIYNSLHLNLGLKKFFEKKISQFKFFFDQKIIFVLYQKIEKYVFNQVIDHYGADYKWNDQKSQNLDKQTQNYGYGSFHYSWVRNQKPKKILCIGSMYGYIPYMLARACEDNDYGKVDFVDAGYSLKNEDNKDTHYFGQGFWNKDMAKKHFSYFLDPKYISTHIMRSDEFAKKYPKNTYDYVCLDGDHSYKGAAADFRLFWPKLNKEGLICFHDIHLEHKFLNKEAKHIKLEFGYKKIWQELVKSKKFKFELSNHYSGLGFIQKI